MMNLRSGVDYGNCDSNIYVDNLFESETSAINNYSSGCVDKAYTSRFSGGLAPTVTPLLPRIVGIQLAYRQ